VSELPLIVTLSLNEDAQAWFDALRRQYFPPALLRVGAHVTMFHALPGSEEAPVSQALAACAHRTPVFPVACPGLRFLGRGVAFSLSAPQALDLRRELAGIFAAWLTSQDRAKWQPHVTVQNKVAPDVACQTHARLQEEPLPSAVTADGVALWRYLGGPWEAVARFGFTPLG
jgi:hypothetical protein